MEKSKIIFRVDGSPEIGLGHIYRCFSLAQMLSEKFNCVFYTCTEIESVLNMIREKFEVLSLSKENHFEQFINELKGDEIVVLDNYFFDSDYQKSIKSTGVKLVCIDDIYDRHFYADLVINQAPGIESEVYSKESYTQMALGLNYALLRPEFLDLARRSKHRISNGNVLVCFGGSDQLNITNKVLPVLDQMDNVTGITVIIGAAYNYEKQLNIQIGAMSKPVLLLSSISAGKMAMEIEKSDLAIIPASTILFEVLTCNIPVITGMYVDNQKRIHDYFKDHNDIGTVIDFKVQDITPEIVESTMNKTISTAKLIDGYSNLRLQNAFLKLALNQQLEWKNPTSEDAKLYFDWVNDKDVRESSYQSNTVNFEDHVNWYNKKIKDPSTLMLLFTWDSIPMGQVRFEIEDDMATIGVSVAKEFRSKKLASTLLTIASNELFIAKNKIHTINAYIKLDNIKSTKAFLRAGFVEKERKNVLGHASVVLSKSL